MNEEGGLEQLAQLRVVLSSPLVLDDRPAQLAAIRLLEDLKNLTAAAQVSITNDLVVEGQARVAHEKKGKLGDAEKLCSVDLGAARRESPRKARRLVGLARTLCTQLPHTYQAMKTGELSEYRAMIVAQATSHLSDADRATLDAEIGPLLPGLGDTELDRTARGIAYRLDPKGFVDRLRRAAADRNVTVRPAPDSMAYLTALLPMSTAVACYAALKNHADTAAATGDPDRPDDIPQPRGLGQMMADELARRLTYGAIIGHDENGTPVRREPTADQPTADLTYEVALIMSDETLINAGDDPVDLPGYGPIPAPVARNLLMSGGTKIRDRLRRLYARPGGRELIAMESRARLFPEYLKRFILYRDRTCRTPWCGAPIRHADHIQPAADGGVTSAANAQGLCAQCNLIKALNDAIGNGAMDQTNLRSRGVVIEWPA